MADDWIKLEDAATTVARSLDVTTGLAQGKILAAVAQGVRTRGRMLIELEPRNSYVLQRDEHGRLRPARGPCEWRTVDLTNASWNGATVDWNGGTLYLPPWGDEVRDTQVEGHDLRCWIQLQTGPEAAIFTAAREGPRRVGARSKQAAVQAYVQEKYPDGVLTDPLKTIATATGSSERTVRRALGRK